MQSKAETVDGYLSELIPERRADLKSLRSLMVSTAPDLQERMAYGMPSYFLGEHMLFSFAAQKRYCALYICYSEQLAQYANQLNASSIGKGCVRFKHLSQLDLDVLKKLLRAVVANR